MAVISAAGETSRVSRSMKPFALSTDVDNGGAKLNWFPLEKPQTPHRQLAALQTAQVRCRPPARL